MLLRLSPARREWRASRMETLTTRKVEIRRVRTEDLRFVYELEEQSFRDPFPNYFIDQLANANPETFLVAVYSGAIVGYAVVDDWPDYQHLVSIAVRDGFRRRGSAQALLDELFERSRPGSVTTRAEEKQPRSFAALHEEWLSGDWNRAQLLHRRRGRYSDGKID